MPAAYRGPRRRPGTPTTSSIRSMGALHVHGHQRAVPPGRRSNGTPRERGSSAAEVDRDDVDDGRGRGRSRRGGRVSRPRGREAAPRLPRGGDPGRSPRARGRGGRARGPAWRPPGRRRGGARDRAGRRRGPAGGPAGGRARRGGARARAAGREGRRPGGRPPFGPLTGVGIRHGSCFPAVGGDRGPGRRLRPGLGGEPEATHSRPRASRWRSRWMPGRTRLIRRGRAPARGAGGARSRAGPVCDARARPRPGCRALGRRRLATASTSQCRATRAGSVRRERCHCQPTPLRARKPSSTHILKAYQPTPTRSGGGSATTTQGSSCAVVQAATRVTVSRRPFDRPSRPRPTQASPGRTRARPGSVPDRRG